MEWLLELDLRLFFAIHEGWRGAVSEVILPFFRNKFFWVPLYVLLFSYMLLQMGKKSWYLIFYVLLGMILTDQISSQLIKPLVGRDRPCKEITLGDRVDPLVRCGSGKSFPSSHAANHFGIALVLGLGLRRMLPWLVWGLLFWAGLISVCQVFVGVHYPSDVIVGALIGIVIGSLLGRWYVQAEQHL